jgi:uncharacterized integral membrane protein (TIGR00697 family)
MTAAPDTVAPTRYAKMPVGHYATVLALFCGLLLISNIGATKAITFGPINTDGGAFLFPLVYVLGDVLSEVYGLKAAKRAIYIGFFLAALAAFVFWVVSISPPAAEWENQEAFEAILGFLPRIVIASLAAYLVGQLLNAWILVKLKEREKESRLWVRLLGSSFVGQGADTFVFGMIAFYGIFTGWGFINYLIVGFVYKVAVEVIMLPVTYYVIRKLKASEPTYGLVTDPA